MGKSNYAMKKRKNRKSPSCQKLKNFTKRSLLYRHIVSIMAAKKRSKTGKCSNSQGMCFRQETSFNLGKTMVPLINGNEPSYDSTEHVYPSKFLIMCLNTIQNSLQNDGVLNIEDKPLFANAWGVEFWNYYSNGQDIMEKSGADSMREQIAWMASAAADTIARKEKEGLSFTGPFLLFLVPSQEKAFKVRQVWKPLETVGIYTLSLHSGTSIEHQIQRLKSSEPEFLVSTPERLLELLSLKAVNTSEVSFLVIDGLEAPFEGSYFDGIKSIRQFISGNPQTVVFGDCMNNLSISMVQKLLQN
ncbi:P-loop containing nucleoside triphosphate hydrolase superfamily protein [Forsythia ovata]|uniref:P-loop containing nucleoside triphosphate hydrolase superfamily protein n=1 Tax=Forsythia ovata TaxID=205694 RepID=A0ABD1WYK5_9LAMI